MDLTSLHDKFSFVCFTSVHVHFMISVQENFMIDHLCSSPFHNLFSPEEYKHLCKSNGLTPFWRYFSTKPKCKGWLKWGFLHLKIFFTQRIYHSVPLFKKKIHLRLFASVRFDLNVLFMPVNIFYLKNIHLCASWLKWCSLHLKMLSTLRIYTSVRVFFYFFH